MVMLSTEQAKEFPRFYMFLHLFFTVKNNKKIWDSFIKWSSLDEDTALNAVKYGSYPILAVEQALQGNTQNYGHFDCNFPNRVTIKRSIIQAIDRSPSGERVLSNWKAFEKLLLHEMVHWGRYKTGTNDDDDPNGVDSGDKFENEAYTNVYAPQNG